MRALLTQHGFDGFAITVTRVLRECAAFDVQDFGRAPSRKLRGEPVHTVSEEKRLHVRAFGHAIRHPEKLEGYVFERRAVMLGEDENGRRHVVRLLRCSRECG